MPETSDPVIDTHLHLWNRETTETPWHPGWARYANRPGFGADEALSLMDAAGVGRAIVIPATWDIQGNEIGIDAAASFPDRFAVFAQFSLRDPDVDRLARLVARPQVLGIRHAFPPGASRSYLVDGTADWFWPIAERLGITVMIWAPGQTDRIRDLATAHPGLDLIVDHVNMTLDPSSDEIVETVAAVASLSSLANIAVKASALPRSIGGDGPALDPPEILRRTVDAFGPHRVFWGSDLTRTGVSYREALSVVDASGLDAEARTLVIGGAIMEHLTWASPRSMAGPRVESQR